MLESSDEDTDARPGAGADTEARTPAAEAVMSQTAAAETVALEAATDSAVADTEESVEAIKVSVIISAANRSIGSTTGCTITEKVATRAFSWLKAPTSAFTFKTPLN